MSVTVVQKKVTLDTPIQRGKDTISEVTLRKPKAGEMRGLALADVLNLDVNALATLLPRITQPIITKDDTQNLDPADLVQLGGEIASFLVPRKLQMDPDSSATEASLTA
jgi:hypothetical protein